MRTILPLALLPLFVGVFAAAGAAQDARAVPECWVRGDRANLELRASPYDSAAVALDAGTVKVCYSGPRKLGRPIMGRLVPHGALYAIRGEREWRIVVNRDVRRWSRTRARGPARARALVQQPAVEWAADVLWMPAAPGQ